MSDALREALEGAHKRVRKALDEPTQTMSDGKALREIVRQLRLMDGELTKALTAAPEPQPVATIHSDGYWTHLGGPDPFDPSGPNAGKARLDVYAAPEPREAEVEAALRAATASKGSA